MIVDTFYDRCRCWDTVSITGQAIRNLERETGHLASVIIAITALVDPISQKRGCEE